MTYSWLSCRGTIVKMYFCRLCDKLSDNFFERWGISRKKPFCDLCMHTDSYLLSNGVSLPAVGLGTYLMSPVEASTTGTYNV